MNEWLWTELHDLFDSDDGSLPEVRVDFVDKPAVISAFGCLTTGSRLINRMGPEWRSAQLRALFQLLIELSRLDPKASVTLDPKTLVEVADRFQGCWSRFVSEQAS